MAGEVSDLIHALRNGSMTLDEVAQRFRERKWPSSKPPVPQSDPQWATHTLQDPSSHVFDSFDDVIGAYDRHEITKEQYRVLADAAADSIGRKPTHDG